MQHAGLMHMPKPPTGLQDLDISESLVADLMLKRLYLQGQGTIATLSQAIRLPYPLIHAVFQNLRPQQLFEVKGMVGNDYTFVLTASGRALAAERYGICQYAGAAPVSLRSYTEAVRAQAARVSLTPQTMREAFSDLVLPDALLDELGPALVSQKAIFLYGPTGNGKTSLAERAFRVFGDAVLIPHAVEVDGQIIVVFDPGVHHRLPGEIKELDARWVPCRRPSIVVGGELDAPMLELQMDEGTRIYAAPAQMKANNGILVIDDFGRQVISPSYLLNRWIVPLDRRVDYLALRYGVKFEIPFETLVVFATNLDPHELADEAFLRRIPNKIHVRSVAPRDFDQIFSRLVAERNLTAEPGCAEHLRNLCAGGGDGQLRACYPRDLIDIVTSISAYEGRSADLGRESLGRAAAIYFTEPD